MTRITGNTIDPGQDQNAVTFQIGGTEYFRIGTSGALKDTFGATLKGQVGGSFTVTSASAGQFSASSLSAFTIPHGLSTTPTIFDVAAATSAAALVTLLGTWVEADATNVYLKTAAAITATKAYGFQWEASP